MTKQFFLAVLASASLLMFSCEKETCAKCQINNDCISCSTGSGQPLPYCGTEAERDSFETNCLLSGGAIRNTSNLPATLELCDEEKSVVSSFMAERVMEGYQCEYVD